MSFFLVPSLSPLALLRVVEKTARYTRKDYCLFYRRSFLIQPNMDDPETQKVALIFLVEAKYYNKIYRKNKKHKLTVLESQRSVAFVSCLVRDKE